MNTLNTKTAKEFIEEGQFMLKLPFFPYAVMTIPSFTIIGFLFVINSSFVAVASLYALGMLLYYKFIFSYTKKGQHYQSFVMQKLVSLFETVRLKSQKL
ncbi:MAG: hypothetical protein LBF71_04950 [Campylobacteraceae bacterium]|jgi:hypothetical protein|nr:hypothetical protein [Campylobacteraceae bacterium]